jgi:hypothetical protein
MPTTKQKRPSDASPKKASASRAAAQPQIDQATQAMLDYVDKYSPDTFAPNLANAGHNELLIRRAVKAGLLEWEKGEPIMLTAKGERALKASRQPAATPAPAAAPEAERQPAAAKATPQATGTRARGHRQASRARASRSAKGRASRAPEATDKPAGRA